jgi:hypothetical protein
MSIFLVFVRKSAICRYVSLRRTARADFSGIRSEKSRQINSASLGICDIAADCPRMRPKAAAIGLARATSSLAHAGSETDATLGSPAAATGYFAELADARCMASINVLMLLM